MASIRSSINLVDNMSSVIDRISGRSDRLKNSIENSQKVMDRQTNFAKNMGDVETRLEIAAQQYNVQGRAVARLNTEYQKVLQSKGRDSALTEKMEMKLLSARKAELGYAEAVEIAGEALKRQEQIKNNLGNGVENATKKQRMFNNELKNGSNDADKLGNKIKSFVGIYFGIRGAKKGIESTIGAAAQLNQQAAVMQAAFGNKDVGKQYFNKLQIYAIDARKDMEELTDVTKNFMQLTKNTDKLMGLTKSANKLAMRTGSIGGAESLMQEAMRGEFSRLQRTLHFTDDKMGPLKAAVQKGSLDGIIGAFDQALNMAGLTDDIVDAFQNSPLEKLGKIQDNLKMKLGGVGEAALANLVPALDKINEWFNSDKANQFFGVISAGLSMMVNGAMWIGEIVAANWGVIEPILLAITSVYLVNMITKTWQAAAAFAAMNWPILLAAGAILVLVKALMQSGVTAGEITGFIAGTFMAMGVTIYNVVAGIWNAFARFAEYLVNVSIDETYAMEMAFYSMAENVLGFFNSLYVGIVGGLNWVIEKINSSLGSNIGSVRVDVFQNELDSLKKYRPASDKSVWEAPKMEFKDYATEVGNAYDWGKQLPGQLSAGLSSIEDSIANFGAQEDMWNGMQQDTLGKLDDTGKKIKNSVDKSNEDLKWMRDMAEQEVINRFTTATMAPQISIEFGDVRETADIDGIVKKLEVILAEQINISTEGVHE